MTENKKASLPFPATCILVSFAFTSYLHRTWISQQIRAFKRLIRHTASKTKRPVRRQPQQITDTWCNVTASRSYNILAPSTRTGTANEVLTTYSTNEHSPWDSDNTSTDTASNLDTENDSDTSSSTEDSTTPLRLHPDQPGSSIPPADTVQWEIELDESIRNGRGPGAWLDRMIDRVVRLVVGDFDAEMRAQIELSAVSRRGMVIPGGFPEI
ncbi:uncharacterized protein N7458_003483 [Penicillium daleae]|uniref:Uncharacterized protein n=1 Tax=Penicillium daleae TaxID=63821 RepID=A0AAD6G790_9EURO|nr:uncharacterized protein N7458_003483 [Penicillium daleae]KAJ5461931.1 hypothetical protein N7458_003483 [Penicillium daleae]